jgi:hypothetical protein
MAKKEFLIERFIPVLLKASLSLFSATVPILCCRIYPSLLWIVNADACFPFLYSLISDTQCMCATGWRPLLQDLKSHTEVAVEEANLSVGKPLVLLETTCQIILQFDSLHPSY